MRQRHPSPLVLIQNIHTAWTKRQRGGQWDVLRANTLDRLPLPEALPLPDGHVVLQTANIYYHQACYFDSSKFTLLPRQNWTAHQSQLPETSAFPLSEQSREQLPVLEFSRENTSLALKFNWREIGGSPSRHPQIARVSLPLGHWCSVKFNKRENEGYIWTYHDFTLNIGFVAELDRFLFEMTPPLTEVSNKIFLYYGRR